MLSLLLPMQAFSCSPYIDIHYKYATISPNLPCTTAPQWRNESSIPFSHSHVLKVASQDSGEGLVDASLRPASRSSSLVFQPTPPKPTLNSYRFDHLASTSATGPISSPAYAPIAQLAPVFLSPRRAGHLAALFQFALVESMLPGRPGENPLSGSLRLGPCHVLLPIASHLKELVVLCLLFVQAFGTAAATRISPVQSSTGRGIVRGNRRLNATGNIP
jgi:hypothetical protein